MRRKLLAVSIGLLLVLGLLLVTGCGGSGNDELETVRPPATPTATATLYPTATPTVAPTATAMVTPTPTPIATVAPTSTPSPSDSNKTNLQEAEKIPAGPAGPPATPTATVTAHPTPTAAPTPTATVTPTPTPTATVAPTSTPSLPYSRKTSLPEAEKFMGVSLPVPTYLPANYEISEVEVNINNHLVMLTISPVTGSTVNSVMNLQIAWLPRGGPGFKLEGEGVDLRGGPGMNGGVIVDRGDHNSLWWLLRPDTTSEAYFEFVLSANKNVPREELIKIARSVRQP